MSVTNVSFSSSAPQKQLTNHTGKQSEPPKATCNYDCNSGDVCFQSKSLRTFAAGNHHDVNMVDNITG